MTHKKEIDELNKAIKDLTETVRKIDVKKLSKEEIEQLKKLRDIL